MSSRKLHFVDDGPPVRVLDDLVLDALVAAVSDGANLAEWDGTLTLEGAESGDGRMFKVDSLDWAPLPLPLMYQPANTGGHSNSVLVGQITHVFRDGNKIMGKGIIDLDAKTTDGFAVGKEVHRLMSDQYLNGVSVDVDKVKDADVEMQFDTTAPGPFDKPTRTVFNRGRIRGATMVAFPAFVEASIHLTGDVLTASALGQTVLTQCGCSGEPETILVATARSSGWAKMPINDSKDWDKGAAVKALLAWAGDDISGKYARAFLYKDANGDPGLQGSYKFPIAEPIDGTLTINANAVRNAAARLSGSDIPSADKSAIQGTLDSILRRIHGEEEPMTAATHTITINDVPPAWWFNQPTDVDMKGALTITDEGRVYGILAPAGVTHRSVDRKVPRNVDYTRFKGAETLVAAADGTVHRVKSGPITFNCGHADTDPQVYGTLENRRTHYDNSCSIFADINIGEDKEGNVWVAGAVKSYATGAQIQQAMSCRLSGDWQPHRDRPGVTEFIAALLVPVPGFATARKEASVTLRDGALVASAIPVQLSDALLEAALRKKKMYKRRVGRYAAQRKLKLATRLGRTGQDV